MLSSLLLSNVCQMLGTEGDLETKCSKFTGEVRHAQRRQSDAEPCWWWGESWARMGLPLLWPGLSHSSWSLIPDGMLGDQSDGKSNNLGCGEMAYYRGDQNIQARNTGRWKLPGLATRNVCSRHLETSSVKTTQYPAHSLPTNLLTSLLPPFLTRVMFGLNLFH
jgi:hypothetical protein